VGRSLILLSRVDPGFMVAAAPPRWCRCGPARIVHAHDGCGDPGLRRCCPTSGPGPVPLPPRSPARCLLVWQPQRQRPGEGTPSASGGPPAVSDFRIVSPDYFRTLEIPVRKDGDFLSRTPPVPHTSRSSTRPSSEAPWLR
jgi:hypothetical protein